MGNKFVIGIEVLLNPPEFLLLQFLIIHNKLEVKPRQAFPIRWSLPKRNVLHSLLALPTDIRLGWKGLPLTTCNLIRLRKVAQPSPLTLFSAGSIPFKYTSTEARSVKAHRRWPKSCFGRVLNLKLDCFVKYEIAWRMKVRPSVEFKTWPRFRP